jgi:hypothetical protein
MRLAITIFVGYFFMGIGKFQATDKYLDRGFISFLFLLNADGWNPTNFGNSSDFGLETFDFGLRSSDFGNSRNVNRCNPGCSYQCCGKIP